MSIKNLKKASFAAAATSVTVGTDDAKKRSRAEKRSGAKKRSGAEKRSGDASQGAVEKLISKIKNDSDEVRTEGWLGAGEVGAAAVKPLAKVMTDEDLEVARAAKRALWKIVRYTGRPKAAGDKRAVEARLLELLGDDQPVSVRREVLWMLSEIGGQNSIKPIAGLLSNEQLREDARMSLERIPNRGAVKALKAGLEEAPEDFKLNIAQSLRKRGVDVPGLACAKLVPTKKTNVQPVK
jgi:HEAT repeat protein